MLPQGSVRLYVHACIHTLLQWWQVGSWLLWYVFSSPQWQCNSWAAEFCMSCIGCGAPRSPNKLGVIRWSYG
jgi:hypothetical protein